jgi:FKBP-type peptidyl-prolyl cis-trans isomerase FklB
VFDQSFIGDFSWKTSAMTQLRCGSFIEGFTTALMDMRVGDHWLVYIPYQMAYGSGSSTTYPAYSNMIFEIALFDCWHPGEKRPPLKTR